MIIKDIRKQRGLTTSAVAARIGITQGFYSQLENGKRSFSEKQLSGLAEILHVSEQSLRLIALSVAEDSELLNHWISNLPIDGIPLKAWLSQSDVPPSGNKQQFRVSLIRFIKKSIEKELNTEFNSNPQLLSYLFQRVKSPILKQLK